MEEGRGWGTKDIAKLFTQPETGVANRMKTLRLVVHAKQMGFEGLPE